MKIAISGKGGSGKTTITALLGHFFSKDRSVILIDADADGNLASTMGFDKIKIESMKPISELKELIRERTGANDAAFFKLNPEVSDIPEKYSLKIGNIKVLQLGSIRKGGSGCFCPENAFLKSLLSHLFVNSDEVVIIDLPAGIEHLGRGTAKAVDCFITIVEPSSKSIQTAGRTKKLAKDLGINNVYFVANKIKNEEDRKFIVEHADNTEILGFIEYCNAIIEADKQNTAVYALQGECIRQVEKLKEKIANVKLRM